MEENNILETVTEQKEDSFVNVLLVNALVLSMDKAFYFLCDDETISESEDVIVETARGLELAKVVSSPIKKDVLSPDEFPKYIKRASKQDLFAYDVYKKKAKEACKITSEEAKKLNLDMTIIGADYTIDGSKVIICYLSETRVDFRELLKSLATLLHCRIELRQIGSRDKAKMVGGIGICGLPLCCSTFLNEFDGISITMAKNQMLALNIPKLSGHCGKLICCLKFENEAYTDAQKDLPKVGQRVRYNEEIYKITSMNVITRMIRMETKENIVTVPYDEIKDLVLPKDYAYNQQQAFQKMKQEEKRQKMEEAKKEENSLSVPSESADSKPQENASSQKKEGEGNFQRNNSYHNNNNSRQNFHSRNHNQNNPNNSQRNAKENASEASSAEGKKDNLRSNPNQGRRNNNNNYHHNNGNNPHNNTRYNNSHSSQGKPNNVKKENNDEKN